MSPPRRSAARARVAAGLRTAALALVLLLAAVRAPAQPVAPAASPAAAPTPGLEIGLLTIGPGEIFFERFGHNAIVVRDPARGTAVAYNYGIFDFEQQDFMLNFARGVMRYRIAVDDLDDDLAMYRAEGRSIVEQPLDLEPREAQALVDFLDWNARPENALYRYDYFAANCSTRVRDALDRALDGGLHAQSRGRSRGYTYRLDALRLMAPQPWLMLLIDLGLGPYADQRIDFWQESFVPQTLSDVVAEATRPAADGSARPLAGARALLAPGRVEEPPALPPDLRWPFLILGLGAGAALYAAGRRRGAARVPLALVAIVFELFCGLGGLVLLFLWLATAHRAAWRNENLLLLNPSCLLLLPAWIAYARRARPLPRWPRAIAWFVVLAAAFALFSKILPTFAQANLHWIVLFLPIHAALALVLSGTARAARA
ncbi:MAG TPA: DUF4105 domain-containing protein [Dokdonella sp.]